MGNFDETIYESKILHTGVIMKKIKIKKLKSRVTWGFSPVTRVKKSKKIYSRNILKTQKKEAINTLLASSKSSKAMYV